MIPPSVVQSAAKSSRVKRSGREAIVQGHSVPRLRILGVVPPVIHKPSCCAQRQHFTLTFIRVSCAESRRYYAMLTNKMHTFKIKFSSSCLLYVSDILWSSSGRLYCTCCLMWYVFHAEITIIIVTYDVRNM
jgi:hypothetical protein